MGLLRAGELAEHVHRKDFLPSELWAIAKKVKEIVQNLVDNALKHSEGRTVEIDVALAPGREAVRLTVRDAGPGIAADVLPHLAGVVHRYEVGVVQSGGQPRFLLEAAAQVAKGNAV